MIHLKHRIARKPIERLAVMVFIFASAGAFISPVYSLFIKRFVVHDNLVGIIISIATLFAIFASLLSGKVIKKYGKIKTLKTTTIFASVMYLTLTAINTTLSLTVIEILRTISITIGAICIGLLVKDISKRSEIDKAEGLTYAFSNIGWFIAPIVGGYLAGLYGFEILFVIASILMILAVISIDSNHFREHEFTHTKTDIKKDIINYFTHNSELRHIYLVSMGLSMFFIITFTYLPLVLSEFSMNIRQIGMILSILILPLIFLEIHVGNLAKKHGDRILISTGFAIITISTISMYIFYNNMTLLIISLVIGYIGASMIEPLKEAYFIKKSPKEHTTAFFGVFRTSNQIASISAPLIASVAITYLKLNGIFLVFIPIFAGMTYISSRLND